MEALKTREIITLPDHVDHVNNPNPNPDVIDLNSHDFAVQLDNHMNNSIVLNDEVNVNQNQANNNNMVPHANVPLIFADDQIPNMENEQQVAANPGNENNYEFEFDSDNEYSVDFREVINFKKLIILLKIFFLNNRDLIICQYGTCQTNEI